MYSRFHRSENPEISLLQKTKIFCGFYQKMRRVLRKQKVRTLTKWIFEKK